MSKYKAYPEYKDSGVEWLGEIPSHWKTIFLSGLFSRTKRTGYTEKELLSVYRDHGVIPKASRDDNNNKPSEDLSPYQLVQPNDLVMNKMKAWQGSIAISEYEGIVSPAYFVYHPNKTLFELAYPKYVHYLLRNPIYITQYLSRSKGIRVNQWDLDPDEFRNIELLLPSKDEQYKIYKFLDHETEKIDNLIEKQQQLIELLKEKRQAVISHAVTKGLNPDVPMKDSGVEWLGKIPTHWIVCHLKQLAKIRNGQDYKSIESETGFPVIGSGGQFAYAKNYMYDRPSVLLGRKGTIDKPLYMNSCFWVVDTMFYTEVNKNIIAKYLYYISTTIQFDKYSTNTALPSMTQENLGNYSLCYSLDPDEQQNILDFIDIKTTKIDTLIQKQLQQIELLKERRTALISAAVTGKIDLRDWTPPASSTEASLITEEATA